VDNLTTDNVSLVSARVPGAGFRFLEIGVCELAERMAAGTLSARELTAAYLRRIAALDRRGPALGAVLEVNPDARAIAAELDAERARSGPRGPLHGIPLLVKDNVATGDRMATSAGSLALAGVRATRDAHLVSRLRDAGAVILGKANLSEWANIRSTRSTSGWSARGGLTRNPHALDRSPSGSSSGSAVAVAASLAAAAVGTETDGSIVSPAAANGIVGLKPTVGLVSRDGVMPISHTQDTAGPMARSVRDAALLLDALAGPDPRDPAGACAPDAGGYGAALAAASLRGVRLGVVRGAFGRNPAVGAVIERALATLASAGATLVDPVELSDADAYGEQELEVLLHELKAGLPRWLADFAPHAPVANLAELIAWNARHGATEMAWFGQELFEEAERRGGLADERYLTALASVRRLAREEGIDAALATHRLDALVAPTGDPAWLIDLINGDHHLGGFSSPAAAAGYPHLTVPAGYVHGLPIGLSFVGAPWSEARLLAFGEAFERAAPARRAPRFRATAG